MREIAEWLPVHAPALPRMISVTTLLLAVAVFVQGCRDRDHVASRSTIKPQNQYALVNNLSHVGLMDLEDGDVFWLSRAPRQDIGGFVQCRISPERGVLYMLPVTQEGVAAYDLSRGFRWLSQSEPYPDHTEYTSLSLDSEGAAYVGMTQGKHWTMRELTDKGLGRTVLSGHGYMRQIRWRKRSNEIFVTTNKALLVFKPDGSPVRQYRWPHMLQWEFSPDELGIYAIGAAHGHGELWVYEDLDTTLTHSSVAMPDLPGYISTGCMAIKSDDEILLARNGTGGRGMLGIWMWNPSSGRCRRFARFGLHLSGIVRGSTVGKLLTKPE
jgi:hypothetical protein